MQSLVHSFKVEIKNREIVDINNTACPTPELAACLRDGLWDILVDDLRMVQFQTVQFEMGPAPRARAVKY
jgi:hypothetical protein